jgi:hypothetical protein
MPVAVASILLYPHRQKKNEERHASSEGEWQNVVFGKIKQT